MSRPSKPKIFRAYDLVRDDKGEVCKMVWCGDYEIVSQRRTREQRDAEKVAEYERVYGKRSDG